MSVEEKTISLGDEHDARLREVVQEVLDQMGAKSASHRRGLAGSQDLENVELEVNGQRLVVEAETYISVYASGERRSWYSA